ncbi:MAG: diphosphomevalonate decarboxylase [Candidatus Bathyarchaeia archaeon]
MKATAVAHPIQGLIKYHGLKKPKQRIPYHDSISVCIKALTTTTTVEATDTLRRNEIIINGAEPSENDRARIEIILDKLKRLANFSGKFRVVSENSLKIGKGLGFSASGFAALGVAAAHALGLNLERVSLSQIVRLGAGSSTRSLAGGFAIWYANKDGLSYAEPLQYPQNIDFSMVIVPIHSAVKTDEAHAEVLSSPLFRARLKNIEILIEGMKKAIERGETKVIGKLAEEDTLNLHAITMTGKSRMILWEPETIRIMKTVIKLREDGIPAWYSIDTGPSVFINTYKENAETIAKILHKMGFKDVLVSGVGGEPFLTEKHLF